MGSMPVTTALEELKQKDQELQASLGCVTRPCLKKDQTVTVARGVNKHRGEAISNGLGFAKARKDSIPS